MRRRSEAKPTEELPGIPGAPAAKPAEPATPVPGAPRAATEDRSSVATPTKPLAPPPPERAAAASALEALVFGPGYDQIVERVFSIDPVPQYDEIEDKLFVGKPGNADYDTVRDALDEAEDNARLAHKLFTNAKVAREAFDRDCEVILASMRDAANTSLQAEKDAGKRSKAITDADVVARMASMFPDEWKRCEDRKLRAKNMVAHLEVLAELWKGRPRSLQVIMSTMRR